VPDLVFRILRTLSFYFFSPNILFLCQRKLNFANRQIICQQTNYLPTDKLFANRQIICQQTNYLPTDKLFANIFIGTLLILFNSLSLKAQTLPCGVPDNATTIDMGIGDQVILIEDAENWAKGVYFYSLKLNNQQLQGKLIKL
jgi:hypothetical protein